MRKSTVRRTAAWAVLAVTAVAAPVCGQDGDGDRRPTSGRAEHAPPLGSAADGMLMMDAARSAWQYVVRHTHPETGLVQATPGYANATTWDIGSAMAAVYSAHGLGIIDDAEYDSRMGRLLDTLEELPLFDGVAYHKVYAVADGRMVDNDGRPDADGLGISRPIDPFRPCCSLT